MSQIREDAMPSAIHPVTQLIAFKTGLPESMVGLFSDFETLLVELISGSSPSTGRIVTAGHVTPEVQLAIHKADKTLAEIVGVSPFTADVDTVLAAISDRTETVFVSNPNRIAGTSWSLSDLEQIALAIPNGLLIVDEYYHDYHGISADPLLTRYANVVVLRSPAVALGVPGAFGYLMASPHRVDQLTETRAVGKPAEADLTILTECLYNTERLLERFRGMHDEALRMIGELSQMGFLCRLTPFDQLLIRVADPTAAGNDLAGHKVVVENLDGYPGLNNQIRVKVQSPSTNDHTLESFRKLGKSGMSLHDRGLRTLRLRRKPEGGTLPDSAISAVARPHRVKAFVADSLESEKAPS
jgi:histidinol-phosphate/aromatic aminotransferase/cobyric acid decarboxylase-like protein